MILMIDNYDSFTYNLVQYLWELGAEVEVRRNDAIGADEAGDGTFDTIIISPGPGRPENAGVTEPVIEKHQSKIPILGICLGHQAIGRVFGARVVRAPVLMHGKTSWIHHDGHRLFQGLPNPFEATRYHSLVVDRDSIPSRLQITATTEDGLVMGLRARPGGGEVVEGVQFHPESILTTHGKKLLANFLAMAGSMKGVRAGRRD
jgi:anthranilate synthase/aminodeoxychorismate synthase-like glutamine amidotransferase